MPVVEPTVDHADDDVGGAAGDIPRRLGMNVGASCALKTVDDEAEISQPPLNLKRNVVRNGGRMHHVVGFDVLDVGMRP